MKLAIRASCALLSCDLAGLTVISTASRPETRAWSLKMSAHRVVDHRRPIAEQVKAIVPQGVSYVLAMTHTEEHLYEIVEVLVPQGALALIENPARPLDIIKLKSKSIQLHREFVSTRTHYKTADMGERGRSPNEVADLVDAGLIRTTMNTNFGLINAANMKRAHTTIESRTAIGKLVLSGFLR
jgi:NADPH:quinone reductase-like Zn-dependent oxidoreductase